MDRAIKIFMSLCVLLVLIVDIQSVLRPIRDARLQGVLAPAEASAFTEAGVLDGSVQRAFEGWIGGRIGFRGFFIKAENQLNYCLFQEFPMNYPTRAVKGRNGNLYEKAILDTFNRLNSIEESKLEKKVKRMKRLQDLLAARGIAFLFFIAPIKTTIYPEDIPARHILRNRQGIESNYGILRPLLDKYGVNYIDGVERVLELKKKSPHLLFAKTSVHWSYYSSCLFTRDLTAIMEKLLRRKITHMQIAEIETTRTPKFLDDDLLVVTNLLFPERLYDTYQYPKVLTEDAGDSYRPSILFVGDSFIFPLAGYLSENGITSRCNFYFYFNTDYQYNGGIKTKEIDRENLDWELEVFNRDVVVIGTAEHMLDNIASGFIEKALSVLE